MSNNNIQEFNKRSKTLIKTLVAYKIEEEMMKQVSKQKKKLEAWRSSNDSNSNSNTTIVENDEAVIALELNSVLDISTNSPPCQEEPLTEQQWAGLRERFACGKNDDCQYEDIREKLAEVTKAYNRSCTAEVNWLVLYKLLKTMAAENNPLLEPECVDFSFCVDLLIKVFTLIKNQPKLFDQQVDCSEWDYVMKFWGPVLEKLFEKSDLRLKWEDTARVVADTIVQHFNVESNVAVIKAAKEDPPANKFTSDRCNLSSNSKVTIDKYLLDGVDVFSVDSLQICGLQLFLLNTSRRAEGHYILDELSSHHITKSLWHLDQWFDLAIDLLCFRDRCVSINNEHIKCITDKKDQVRRYKNKRTANDLDD